jgi:hypothetical protein
LGVRGLVLRHGVLSVLSEAPNSMLDTVVPKAR